MENLFGLVEAFYSRFILRDLLAKVTPGFILLGPSTYLIIGDSVFDIEITFGLGVLLFAICWITGFAIQGIGEFTTLIKYHINDDARDDYSKYMLQLKNNKISNDKDLERNVVIKETCGNSHVSLLLLAIIMLSYFLINYINDLDLLIYYIPFILLYILMFASLRYMHIVHIERQDKIVSERLE